MKRFELEFIEGPGAGRTLEVDAAEEIPKTIWLCKDGERRYWRFKEPRSNIEMTYKIVGHLLRPDERYAILYGWDKRTDDARRAGSP